MDLSNIAEIANGCDRFLDGHRFFSVRKRVQAIADSPLSLKRNDGYGHGGVVADLEERVADLLGKEAAVFMPSGTMAQQIALRIWADLSGIRQVAFHPTCHLQIHEHMAYHELHGLEGILLGDPDRLFTLVDLKEIMQPISTLLIELPQREIGGQLPTWSELTAICEEARSRGAKLHLDGARLWECQPFYDRSYAEICGLFDSVYVSFYKILGGLPGAMLTGPRDMIETARIWQRRHGGNLQQQSPNAIAATLGLETELPKIPAYVAKAKQIARILNRFKQVRVRPSHPPTNMMHLYFAGNPESLVHAALQIAVEDKVGMFFGLGPDGKLEFVAGEGTLDFGEEEIYGLFVKLFGLASQIDSAHA